MLRPCVLVALGLSVVATAQTSERSPIGLKNRWYAEGGSASRSGAVATAPLDEAPERAWQFEAPGTIVGEPLVWDDVVVFECELPKGKRRLLVIGLADGVSIAHRDFIAKIAREPIAPALWNRDVVVRAGEYLKRYRFGPEGISEQRRSRKVSVLGRPLCVDDEVYLIADHRIERWRPSDLKQVWRSNSTSFRGTIAVAGNLVYGVRGSGNDAQLVQLRRDDGSRLRNVDLPPITSREPKLAVGPFAVIARDVGTIDLTDGNKVDSLRYDLPLPRGDAVPLLAAMPAAPAIGVHRWIAGCGTVARPLLGLGKKNAREFTVLATRQAHERLLSAPVTMAGHLAYIGGTAVDVETLEVRWRIDAPAGARAIPGRDTLLFKDGNKIVAFQRPGADVAAITLARHRAWKAVYEAAQDKELRELVADALQARELDLVDDLLRRCRAVGVDEKWVATQARLRKARSRVKKTSEPARLAAMQRRAEGIDAIALTSVWRQLDGADLDTDDRLRALRFVHDLDAAYPALAEAVRVLVPEELRPEGEFDIGEWLGFAESTRAIPIDFLPVPTESEIGRATADQLKLLELRATWRKDLIAVQSPRLLVYTPVSAPGGLARCLSLGELVCDTLEAMFEGYPQLRQDPRRMRILLYPTQQEYKKFSPGGGHLAWTAGHYSPQEELSRMFLPRDQQAFSRVMPVFVHELTHQWLQDRCPAIHAGRAARRPPDQPAYWVVEGFAGFVEQFVFDLERRTHKTDSSRDENLDILGHATRGQMLRWRDVLRVSPLAFHRISPVPAHSVKLGYRLGVERALSPKNLFYAQSGALCHWLWHADSGARRKKLLDFVIAHYHDERGKLDLGKELGMEVGEIGAAVEGYAKARRH